jgi:nitric oxide reductase NorE protein
MIDQLGVPDRGRPARPSSEVRDRTDATRVPGEVGLWTLIFGDILAFAVFFAVFMYNRGADPALFDQSRRQLNVGRGVANTLLLLTSSLFVVIVVHAYGHGSRRLAARLSVLAVACGLGFVVNKAFEYHAEISRGFTPATNAFFMFFYTMTGIHLFHVVVGLAGLLVMLRVARRRVVPAAAPRQLLVLEVCAIYWHMVDLLWVVIFSLLYLVK